QREESAAGCRELPLRAARRPGERVHAHPARRHADRGRGLRAERRLVLVRQRERRGDPRGLSRGRLAMASALINMPARAKRGEIIEIKTLISHAMETGYRSTQLGA